MNCLPRAVVEVRVPRGPGAVEGKGQLLVVLVLLTPHPEGGEHFSAQKKFILANQVKCQHQTPPGQLNQARNVLQPEVIRTL